MLIICFAKYSLQNRGKGTKIFLYTQARGRARAIFQQKVSKNTHLLCLRGYGLSVTGYGYGLWGKENA